MCCCMKESFSLYTGYELDDIMFKLSVKGWIPVTITCHFQICGCHPQICATKLQGNKQISMKKRGQDENQVQETNVQVKRVLQGP